MSALTANEPADSPKIVTFCGLPPKAAMLSRTQRERRHLIEQAVVARGVPARLARQLGMREEPEDAQPVVDRDDHDALARERVAVVPRLRRRRPAWKPPPWIHTITGSRRSPRSPASRRSD